MVLASLLIFENNQTVSRESPTRQTRRTPADFRNAATVFKALGNPNRLLILHALSGQERNVAELTEWVGLDISTVSNHLAVLRNLRIVCDERRGNQVFYSLRKPCIMNLFCCMEDFQEVAGDRRVS